MTNGNGREVPKIKLFKEPEGRERSLSPEQANRLLAELPLHLRDMALFTLHTGLRQSNVLHWNGHVLIWHAVMLGLVRRILRTANRSQSAECLRNGRVESANRQASNASFYAIMANRFLR